MTTTSWESSNCNSPYNGLQPKAQPSPGESCQTCCINVRKLGPAERVPVVARSHNAQHPLSTRSRRVGHSLATPVVASTDSHDLQASSNGTIQTKQNIQDHTGGETIAETRDTMNTQRCRAAGTPKRVCSLQCNPSGTTLNVPI